MRAFALLSALAALAVSPLVNGAASQTYTWKNVKIGGGGGFVPGFVFSTKEKGIAYARTDIGGLYKLNADDSWTPLLDFADNDRWNYWGVDTFALDPTDSAKIYAVTGMYTNSWDPNNGQVLISKDYGATWSVSKLPFKVGGNMPGRGMGERIAVDPNLPSTLFYGARSGNGLYKSTDSGLTWSKVSGLKDVGTFVVDPSDSTGYNSDKMGVSFVTFDSTSSSSGKATPRVFVGVATKGGSANIYVSNDGGSSFTGITGTNTTWIPHKGVLSPAEKSLYITTSDGAGPYDGTYGGVYKYNITSGTITNITPVSGSDLYFGFGGFAVDLQKPGTIMTATLNSWWPDGNIFRSTDGGATWKRLWEWSSYPSQNRYYTYDDSLAPWLGPNYTYNGVDLKQIGWMMEALVIDPFDSNHWLYGTGATIYGGHDLTKWDTTKNITLKALADGVEETSIQNLISPPSGPNLLSAVGDIGGFRHDNLDKAPSTGFVNPTWATTIDIDFAGNKPTNLVRIGTGDSSSGKQVAISTDSGATWNQDYGAPDNVNGGKVAFSADGDTVLWRTSANGVLVSRFTNAFTAVSSLPSDVVIASDKKNNSIFYAASGNKFYISRDGGVTFTSPSTLGASTAPAKIVNNLNASGDIWVSTDKGLFHSTNFGTTFTTVSAVAQAWQIALGAPKTTGGYPALFANAKIDNIIGYYRSDDAGVNWIKINDDKHGFGAAGTALSADPRIYGRVYIGTNGRGIFYGDASGTSPSPTATSSTVSSTSGASSTVSSTSSTVSSTSKTTSTTISSTSKTSSTSVSTTKTSTSATATATGVALHYAQCGGQGWTGPTVCESPYTCTASNIYYSQCI